MSILKINYKDILNLQAIDCELIKENDNLNNIKEEIELKELLSNIEAAKKQAGTLKDNLNSENTLLKKQKNSFDLINAKIKAEEKKLFSGKVTNAKELSALQEEIASLKRRNDEIETQVLEQMEKTDSVQNQTNALLKKIDIAQAKAAELEKILEEKKGKIKAKINKLREKRNKQAAKIDKEILEEYEEIRGDKNGVGASALIGGVCEACHVALPESEVDRILAKEGYDYCPSCNRILIASRGQ